MIRGAIFDVDGTLMDSMWVWQQAFKRFLLAHDAQLESAKIDRLFTMSLGESGEFFRKELNLAESPAQLSSEIAAYAREAYLADTQLKPQVPEFLGALAAAGVQMVILTSGEAQIVQEVLTKLGVAQYFSRIYAATNEGITKREPTLYLRAAEFMGVTPAQTCVFEDAVYAVTVAKKHGFHTVGIADSHSADQQAELRTAAEVYWEQYPAAIPPEIAQM